MAFSLHSPTLHPKLFCTTTQQKGLYYLDPWKENHRQQNEKGGYGQHRNPRIFIGSTS